MGGVSASTESAVFGFQQRCDIFSESQVALGLAIPIGKRNMSCAFPRQTSQVRLREGSGTAPGALAGSAALPRTLGDLAPAADLTPCREGAHPPTSLAGLWAQPVPSLHSWFLCTSRDEYLGRLEKEPA